MRLRGNGDDVTGDRTLHMRVVPVCLASADRWPSAGQQTSRESMRTGSLGGLHQVVRVFQMRHERRPPQSL